MPVRRGRESASVAVTIKTDSASAFREGAYTVELSGDYADRYALSADGQTWEAWGAAIALAGPVDFAGVVVYVKKRALVADPIGATSTRASLVLKQDGITVGATVEIGAATDVGTGSDSSSLTTGGTASQLGNATDAGTGADSASIAAAVPLDPASDTGSGADSASLGAVATIGTASDAGTGTDAASLTTGGSAALTYSTDFSVGQAMNANMETVVAGSGTAVEGGTALVLSSSISVAAGSILRHKTAVNWAASQTYAHKGSVNNLTSGPLNLLGIRSAATIPGIIASASDDLMITCDYSGSASGSFYVQYKDSAGTWRFWDKTANAGAGAWTTTATLSQSWAADVDQIAEFHHDTTQWWIVIKSATGTVQMTTSPVAKSATYGAANPWWVQCGDRFTDLGRCVLYVKVASLTATA